MRGLLRRRRHDGQHHGGDIGAAAVYGSIAGHHAADYQTLALAEGTPDNAEERMAFYSAIY